VNNHNADREELAKKTFIYTLANPRSGDQLASQFLVDYPHINERTLTLEEYRQKVQATMWFYDVTVKAERTKCY